MCSLWEDYPAVLADVIEKLEKRNWELIDDFGDIQQYVEDYDKLLSEMPRTPSVMSSEQNLMMGVGIANSADQKGVPLEACDVLNQQPTLIPDVLKIVTNNKTDRLASNINKTQPKEQQRHKAPPIVCKRSSPIVTPVPKYNTIRGRTSSSREDRPRSILQHGKKSSCSEGPVVIQWGKLRSRADAAGKTNRKGGISFRKPTRQLEDNAYCSGDISDDNGDFIVKYVAEQVDNLPKEVYDRCVRECMERKRSEAHFSKKRIGSGTSNPLKIIKPLEKGRVGATRRSRDGARPTGLKTPVTHHTGTKKVTPTPKESRLQWQQR